MVKRSIGILIFLALYFTIMINFSNTIVSWFNAFIQQNAHMFEYNTTQLTYQYKGGPNGGQIVTNTQVVTVNYAPFLTFLVYLIIYFIIPIAGPILYIFWAFRR